MVHTHFLFDRGGQEEAKLACRLVT